MGSYGHLEIDGHPVFPMKSYVDRVFMSFFEECDHKVFTRRLSERSESTWGTPDEDDDSTETAYEYQIESSKLKERLDIQGFTLQATRRTFGELVAESLRSLVEDDFVPGFWWLDNSDAEVFLRNYTFDVWMTEVRQFLASGAKQTYSREELGRLSTAQKIIADYDSEDYLWGFPMCDPRLIIRGLLEVFPEPVSVVLDYTELVSAGYYEGDESLASDAKLGVSKEFIANSKIVVLTEGSTDATILSESLRILYPHLFPLFSFLDFHEPRLAGGASNLVHVLKGFVGAQIANRIIALFDNDTAAAEALRSLDLGALPDRFKVLHYPAIPLGETYPTIGPQGETEMNINGLAGSIELYLGEDVLRGEDGSLEKVQWKGYNQALQKYQGELIGKRELQEKFTRKIREAGDGENHPEHDWSGMRAIWNSIFAACIDESNQTQQAGAGQPATRPESKSESSDNPQPEAEGRSR